MAIVENCTAADSQFVEKTTGRRVSPPRPLPGTPSLPLLCLHPPAALWAAPSRSPSAPRQVLMPQRSICRTSSPASSPAQAKTLHCHPVMEESGSRAMILLTLTSMFPCGKDGWKEGHLTATVANGSPEEQWDTLIAKWNRLKGQAWEVESKEGGSMWLVDCIANQRRLLEDKEEELKRVAEEHQQKEDVLEDKEEELKWVAEEQQQKENVLEDKEEELKWVAEEQQQQENALLLERLLLRERRMRQEEEEEASRARRINNPRLSRSNSDEDFMGGLGAAYYADHMIKVLPVGGTNARPDLFLPLLQHGQIPAFAPIPAGIPSPSPTPVPTTAKPKTDVSASSKLAMM